MSEKNAQLEYLKKRYAEFGATDADFGTWKYGLELGEYIALHPELANRIEAELAVTKAERDEFAKAIVKTWQIPDEDFMLCAYCDKRCWRDAEFIHEPDCIVLKAQRIVEGK